MKERDIYDNLKTNLNKFILKIIKIRDIYSEIYASFRFN